MTKGGRGGEQEGGEVGKRRKEEREEGEGGEARGGEVGEREREEED